VPGLRIFTKSDVASMEHNFYFYVSVEVEDTRYLHFIKRVHTKYDSL
jgi:hypothetical protein